MRWWPVLMFLVPLAAGQAPLLEDDEGDVWLEAGDSDLGQTPAGGDGADLLALDILESDDALTFVVSAATIASQTDYVVQHYIHFAHGDMPYSIRLTQIQTLQGDWQWALYAGDADASPQALAFGEAATDPAANSVAVSIPRDYLLDSQGGAPRPGSPLHSIWVDSTANDLRISIGDQASSGLTWRDDMGADAMAEFPLALGIEQKGDLRLSSETPYRASNGEATTFLFEVTLRNIGTREHIASLEARDLPRGWDVVFPVDVARIAAGDSRQLAVVVSTPFAHQHGSLENLIVEAKSQSDANSIGRIELGVRYPTIPQPAGHHDTLYFHSRQATQDAFTLLVYGLNEALIGAGTMQTVTMNTVEDDALDEDVPAEAQWCGSHSGTTPFDPVFCWPIYLAPNLAMGLDFELGREGTLKVPIQNLLPAPTRLGGTLQWLGPPRSDGLFVVRDSVVLADIVGTTVELPANGQTDLEARIVPTPEADYVPFAPGASLMLDLQVLMDRPDNFFLGPKSDKPDLLPGGELTLPLLEYQDPIDDVFGGQGLLDLTASETHRLVNPGETVVFTLQATNHGPAPVKASLRLIGNSDGWASLTTPTLDLPTNGSKEASIVVAVPSDALDGDRADLLVELGASESLDRVLVRLVAEVDTDEDHPDDLPPAAKPTKDSPGLPLLPLLGAVGLAMRARSKRS